MRAGLGVAKDDNVVEMPFLAEDPREVAPVGAVEEERVALKLLCENLFQLGFGAFLVKLLKPVPGPGRLVRFEDPGRMVRLILIAVGDHLAVFGLPEEIVEFVHWPGGTHPAEPVGLPRQARLETVPEMLADRRVHPVGGDDHV